MNKKMNIFIMLIIGVMIILNIRFEVFAADSNEYIDGNVYELGENDKYDLSKAYEVPGVGRRFFIEGDFTINSTINGVQKIDVNSGNLKLKIDTQYAKEFITPLNTGDWKVINDKTKIVDSTQLEENIGMGAIIVQVSKDGVAWINSDCKIDFYNGLDNINNREINGENTGAFYLTSNVQLNNGCYYRIIVAYKIQKEDPNSKGLFAKKEEKERVEIYKFYASNPEANAKQLVVDKNTYEYSTTNRVDSSNGFDNPQLMKSDDPHIDWNIGSFYVNGYTRVTDDEVPTFLKTPKDKTVLWFNLLQDINKCNGNNDIKVDYTKNGSDIEFGTPTINDWGKGTLIVRKKDRNNKIERQIYTNYLEATATVGANNRIDLFEEGDYEVALDYQLHYDKPSVFGTKAAKTLSYRIKFEFKVRNADISSYLIDCKTKNFIDNANVAENGFYIDVCNSKYLDISVERQEVVEGIEGFTFETKTTSAAKDLQEFVDEGKYIVTVKNPATGSEKVNTIYVGTNEEIIYHLKTGKSLASIREVLNNGGYFEDGELHEPEPEVTEEEEDSTEMDEEKIDNSDDNTSDEKVPDNKPEKEEVKVNKDKTNVSVQEVNSNKDDDEQNISEQNDEGNTEIENEEGNKVSVSRITIISIIVIFVCLIILFILLHNKKLVRGKWGRWKWVKK